ncbi:arginine--tRNA ligase [Veillonella sp. YH-vei2232]|uniref:Arginine--tRNA ligase n=1 Tax=Veillonella absiana TaxID=3079305 RepID=A0ABU3Z6M8_9FIRM|nr:MULTISPECIES: arginine--tRNA ligase [unclassified Veillonella]MDV5063507.1 arginine--tRNA ligase [Veillonella sp. YH-vei2232]MDV5087568.1 arginine--tRNA ligase [Veillonella sp. YH-vei2233]
MDMKEILKQGIETALEKTIASGALPAGEYPEIVLEVPPQKEFGDFSSNIAMQSARVARQNPRAIADALVANMDFDWLDRAEVAGAGFINFFLKSDMVYDTLKAILAAGDNYGVQPTRSQDTVQVEYVSANPTGPLHVGHGRGAAYGSALVNLLRAAGFNVQAEYYINDAGNQIDNMAMSVEARFQEIQGKHLVFPDKEGNIEGEVGPNDIVFPANGYRGDDITETAQAIIDEKGLETLNAMSVDDRVAMFKETALQEKLKRLEETLRNFQVTFNQWFSERSLHDTDEIKYAVDELKNLGAIYEKDGALWLNSTKYGDDKDRVVIRDNGVPTYLAADIAYHRNKYERGFKQMINIWGADHHGYVCRVKAAMQAFDFDPDKLEILLLQMVALFRDGEMVKLSKRTGDTVTLDELIEEVGVDASRYFFLMRSLDSQLDFDINLAKSRSNDNPVYYIQYAHARIHSIYNQVRDAGIKFGEWDAVDFSPLTSELELELIKKLAEYPEEITQSAEHRAPHRIARYLYDLASMFHSFYRQGRIIGVDSELQQARLGLITAIALVLRQGLGILGISAPEKM